MNEIKIRSASRGDARELLAIYAPYVRNTAITFEYEVPGEAEFEERIQNTLRRYPYLAAVRPGTASHPEEITGYAYVSPFKERAAYGWSVETSIYVKSGEHGKGIGTLLYEALEAVMRKQGVQNMNACIAWPNPESVSFHERFGYRTVAHFTKCGYKQGRWYDMIWMEKLLGDHEANPEPIIPYTEEMLEQALREINRRKH